MRVTASTFLLLLVCLRPCFAESENDMRHKHGDGENNDGAAYWGDQKTKQMLTPDMMGHYSQASMYFAMGNIPMGAAEQAKGDMLKQQIQANGQTADQNRNGEKLIMDGSEATGEQLTSASANQVLTVDKERLALKQGGAPGIQDTVGATPAVAPPDPASPSSSAPTDPASSGMDASGTTAEASAGSPNPPPAATSASNSGGTQSPPTSPPNASDPSAAISTVQTGPASSPPPSGPAPLSGSGQDGSVAVVTADASAPAIATGGAADSFFGSSPASSGTPDASADAAAPPDSAAGGPAPGAANQGPDLLGTLQAMVQSRTAGTVPQP